MLHLRVSWWCRRVYSNAKAKRLLGFRPRYDIQRGLQQTIASYRLQGQFAASKWDPVSPLLRVLLFGLLVGALIWWLWQAFMPSASAVWDSLPSDFVRELFGPSSR